jgi:hypothetical protein
METRVRTLLALLALTPAAVAAPDGMLPTTMEVGKIGELWPDGLGTGIRGTVVEYTIAEVGPGWLALRVTGFGDGPDTIVVRGVPTDGLVDGRRWKPKGTWKVEATEKYKGKTVFSLRPHK